MLDLDFFLSNPDIIFLMGVLHFVILFLLFAFLTANSSLPADLLAIEVITHFGGSDLQQDNKLLSAM